MSLLSALVTSLALAALALPAVKTAELTPDNFGSSVAKGLWFIEHYSPYCGHCRAFAPTWEKLVKDAETEFPTVSLAQVNCVLHGDLCDQNDIKGYPTMLMFEDGKIVDQFNTARELPELKKFIQQHVKEAAPATTAEELKETPAPEAVPVVVPPPQPPKPILNPAGEVLPLNLQTFSSALAKGPTFVKFFAPWCGHCKKLAPVWKQLARHMQGKVQIAEVNCDDEGALCKSQDIRGYPTLIYFANGARSEYNGGRKIDQLKSFSEKASADGVQILSKADELEAHIEEQKVVYVLIHGAADTEIVQTIRSSAAPLFGSPTVYATSSSSIRTKYNVPAGIPWALLCLKDHDADTPAATIYGSATVTPESLKSWLLAHRLPGSLELTQDTFQGVMNAPQAPLVVITASTKALSGKIEERMRDVAKKWKVRTGGSGEVNGREVIFTWMDAERWKEWMKSMYGLKVDADDKDLDDVKVVIADHKNLIYYDEDRTGYSLKVTSTGSLFAAIEDAVTGKLSHKNSENIIERLARNLNSKMTSLEAYIAEYPFRFIGFLLAGLTLVFWLLYKWIGSDANRLERGDYGRTKSSRLD